MLEFIRGDSRTIAATVYTDSTHVTPQNLSAATAIRFTARQQDGAKTQVFQKTLAAASIAIVNAALGTLTITIAPSDTSALVARNITLDYDLEITWTGGAVATVDIGLIDLTADVSY
jgi:hypothetical protein